jgi:hypothetical protein
MNGVTIFMNDVTLYDASASMNRFFVAGHFEPVDIVLL